MKATYEMVINGPDAMQVERAIRVMDKLVRRWYNVYGGFRAYSGNGYGGMYYVFMEYTADWYTSGVSIWPDFTDIKRAFFQLLGQVDPDDMLEVEFRQVPGKG